MLDLAVSCRARLLLSSTSEVYGDPDVHPHAESYWGNVNPIGIRSCYDEGKRIAETLCFEYHRRHNVAIRVARIFNTYGPRMLENDGRVVSNFIMQALQRQPITIYGDGSQTRSFCYVSDMVTALISLMNGDYIGPVNLGNPGEYTIRQLADSVQQMINPDATVEYKPVPSDDPRRRKPDISKAKQYLRWEPTVPLKDGLKLTIEDFSQRYAAKVSASRNNTSGGNRSGGQPARTGAAATTAAGATVSEEESSSASSPQLNAAQSSGGAQRSKKVKKGSK